MEGEHKTHLWCVKLVCKADDCHFTYLYTVCCSLAHSVPTQALGSVGWGKCCVGTDLPQHLCHWLWEKGNEKELINHDGSISSFVRWRKVSLRTASPAAQDFLGLVFYICIWLPGLTSYVVTLAHHCLFTWSCKSSKTYPKEARANKKGLFLA